MPCCNASSYLAVTYQKEGKLTKVSEIMCCGCLNIISVYKAKQDRDKKAIAEKQNDNGPKISNIQTEVSYPASDTSAS